MRKMGNSVGMIVPKALLKELGATAGTPMDVRVEEGRVVATPLRRVREGWEEDANRIGAEPLTEEERDWMAFGDEGDGELAWRSGWAGSTRRC